MASRKDRNGENASRRSSTEFADDAVTLLEPFVASKRLATFRRVASERQSNIAVVLDGIDKYHNISAVLRSADAFGVCDVWIIGEKLEYSRGVSRGTERWLRLHISAAAENALAELRAANFEIAVLQSQAVATSQGKQSVPVYQLPFERKIALVFGNELQGVSNPFLASADFSAHIPMFGFVESFNISVAAAVTLFCSTLRDAKPRERSARLSQSEQEQLIAEWLRTDVRGGEAILKEVRRRKKTK